jgi:hypothetical protein
VCVFVCFHRYFKGSRQKVLGHVPFGSSYVAATSLLQSFVDITEHVTSRFQFHTMPTIHTISVLEELFRKDLYDGILRIMKTWPGRTLAALPDRVDDVAAVLRSEHGTKHNDFNRSIRDLGYLREHGVCVDFLEVKPSTIVHAGRGVFATKRFAVNEVVTAVPLLHLPNRTVLDVQHDEIGLGRGNKDKKKRKSDSPSHPQLLLNYCFGHRDASILLCPYGIFSSLINHAPTTAHDRRRSSSGGSLAAANVKAVWSSRITTHPEWRDMPIHLWAYQNRCGLGFEYVATREISAGDEIFLDYGIEWERAWEEHVKWWKSESPRVANQLNREEDSMIPTVGELRGSSGLWCYTGMTNIDQPHLPCKVISRVDRGGAGRELRRSYVAELVLQRQNQQHGAWCDEVVRAIHWDAPPSAFLYGGGPISDVASDPRADAQARRRSGVVFRHDIRIPDELLPAAWRENNAIP